MDEKQVRDLIADTEVMRAALFNRHCATSNHQEDKEMVFIDLVDRSSGFTWTVEAHVLPREGDVISLDAEFFPAPPAAGYVVRQVGHRFIGTRHEVEVSLDVA